MHATCFSCFVTVQRTPSASAILLLSLVCITGCGAPRTSKTSHVTDPSAEGNSSEQDVSAITIASVPTGKTASVQPSGNQRRGSQPPRNAANKPNGLAPGPVRPPVRRTGPGGMIDITFDDLALDMPAGTLFSSAMMTPRARELDGKNVRLRGFIFAGGVFQSVGIQSFPFVMNTQCKFGPQGLAYCVILVELEQGITTDFTTYPITVEGKLSVRPFNSDGFTWSVYHLRGKKVY